MRKKKVLEKSYMEMNNFKAAKINRFLSSSDLVSQVISILHLRALKTNDPTLQQKYHRNRELLNAMKADLD